MFFLLDAKITILYLFSMQKLVESLYKSVHGKISKKHSECRKNLKRVDFLQHSE